MGSKVERVVVVCSNCKKTLRRRPKEIITGQKRFFCNVACKGEWQKTRIGPLNQNYGPNPNLRGKKNPNYGNHWTDEQKAKAGKRIKRSYQNNPRRRWLAGTANRGKKFSSERVAKSHKNRTPESYSRPCSEKAKKIIGEKSAAKWTPEFKKQFRETMVSRGYWTAESDRSDREVYYREANWCARMFDIISPEDTRRLAIFGVWGFENRNGLVRDHKYSRKSGFTHRVFPELMRHPINCQVITHGENVSKAQSNTKNSDDITLDQLLETIVSYEKDWKEQGLCIELVIQYRAGQHWQRKEVA